ncbi:hypothetical protein BB561_005334 [Smittium simulii]|uniref:EF-hand domain-containing protein n=1 Tax=Smittium simulii TaxID=133385 RepID=A0A2T9YAY2_9FUNG|nr:hypothetical protein BB561_005334 [Smittium simulii]
MNNVEEKSITDTHLFETKLEDGDTWYDNIEDEVPSAQKKKSRALTILMWLSITTFGCAVLFFPCIYVLIEYPEVPLSETLNQKNPKYIEFSIIQCIGCMSILLTGSWILFRILNLIFGPLLNQVQKLAIRLIADPVEIKQTVVFINSLKTNILVVVVLLFATLLWSVYFFNDSVESIKLTKAQYESYYILCFKILMLGFVSSILFLLESMIMRGLARKFHRQSYKVRVERQKKMEKALTEIQNSPKFLADNLEISVSANTKDPSLFYNDKKMHTAQKKVKRLAHLIFITLLTDKSRNFLIPEDLMNFFEETEKGAQMFTLFDNLGSGTITSQDFQATCIECYFDSNALNKTLTDMSMVLRDIHRFFLCLIILMIMIMVLMVVSYDPLKNIASLATLFSSFDCFVYLFMANPYDVGDHVLIEGKNLIVEKIRLLTTVFYTTDGRSDNQTETFDVEVQFNTPKSKIDQLESILLEFVENNPLDFKPGIAVRQYSLKSCAVLSLKILCKYRNNWQNFVNYANSRSIFIEKIKSTIIQLEIHCTEPLQPISFVKDSPDTDLMSFFK